MDNHDSMKIVELGLIYSNFVPETLFEGKEYFKDFMNLLVEDASEAQKSQVLTQDSSSGRTVGKKQEEQPQQRTLLGLKETHLP